jgi:PIN domain nuclease of toxin-antitoxin system
VILLDTNALIWADHDTSELGSRTRQMLDEGLAARALSVSAVTFWECANLCKLGRLTLRLPVAQWRDEFLAAGVREIPLDGRMALGSVDLDLPQKDPANRFIVATALAKDALLVTADERILAWTGPLRRQDARL